MQKYQKICEIGSGSFGIVYKVRDDKGKYFALKEIELDDSHQIQVDMEYLLTKDLHHENIIRTIEGFEVQEEGSFAIILELAVTDLKGKIQDQHGRPFSETVILKIMKEVSAGVKYLHGRGIVHRDIKPENILLSEDDVYKISDFGQSKSIDTLADSIVGTPSYRAPEQYHDLTYSFEIDIWALGCTYFEILSLQPLFEYDSNLKLNVITGRIKDFPKGAPTWAKIIIKKMIQLNAKKRPTAEVVFDYCHRLEDSEEQQASEKQDNDVLKQTAVVTLSRRNYLKDWEKRDYPVKKFSGAIPHKCDFEGSGISRVISEINGKPYVYYNTPWKKQRQIKSLALMKKEIQRRYKSSTVPFLLNFNPEQCVCPKN